MTENGHPVAQGHSAEIFCCFPTAAGETRGLTECSHTEQLRYDGAEISGETEADR